MPDDSEIAANPRSRSAKLRAAERTPATLPPGRSAQRLARLPSLDDVLRGRSG
jgi:16S rRNA (cytosine1402-N4)-methyltransferase